jgi:hypothetical protein
LISAVPVELRPHFLFIMTYNKTYCVFGLLNKFRLIIMSSQIKSSEVANSSAAGCSIP